MSQRDELIKELTRRGVRRGALMVSGVSEDGATILRGQIADFIIARERKMLEDIKKQVGEVSRHCYMNSKASEEYGTLLAILEQAKKGTDK